MNNYEKIKKMTLEEMISFIHDTNSRCNCAYECNLDCFENTCEQGIREWLVKECE